MRNVKVLTTAALASLLASVAVSGVFAQPGTSPMPTMTPSPMMSPGAIVGQITQIAGENVTVRLANGTTTTIRVPSSEITRLALRPGSNVSYVLGSGGVPSSISIVSGSSSTTVTETTTTTTRPVPTASPIPVRPTPMATPIPVRPTPMATPMATPVAPRAPRALW